MKDCYFSVILFTFLSLGSWDWSQHNKEFAIYKIIHFEAAISWRIHFLSYTFPSFSIILWKLFLRFYLLVTRHAFPCYRIIIIKIWILSNNCITLAKSEFFLNYKRGNPLEREEIQRPKVKCQRLWELVKEITSSGSSSPMSSLAVTFTTQQINS